MKTCRICRERDKQYRAWLALSLDAKATYREDVEGPLRPSRWWDCEHCGAHLERWRGQGDVSCECGAQYNAGGQRLRDDWRPYIDDDDLGDMEQHERAMLRAEAVA